MKNAPISETGMTIIGISVALQLRKKEIDDYNYKKKCNIDSVFYLLYG